MIDEKEVHQNLENVINNQLSLERFEEWLFSNSWNMHSDSPRQAIDLVASIHLLLSERDDHIYSNAELIEKFRALLRPSVQYANIHYVPFAGAPIRPNLVLRARRSAASLQYFVAKA